MPRMTEEQLRFLNAEAGAFSIVTEREANEDKCITLDIEEKRVLTSRYQLDSFIRRGNHISNNSDDRKIFNTIINDDITSHAEKEILIVHPKSSGNELRLYMNASINFTGNHNDIFIIYTARNLSNPIIGFVSQEAWVKFTNHSDVIFIIKNENEEDIFYQQAIFLAQAKIPNERRMFRYERDVSLAKDAIERASYRCEVNHQHQTFISPLTNAPFMEAHHIIPLGSQHYFKFNIDHIDNICSLCPNCHRKIHYGQSNMKRILLRQLFDKRKNVMDKMGINFDVLCMLYGTTS